MLSSFWQPSLKATGRWQLEMSHLAAKQVRANVALVSSLARATSPMAIFAAYREYGDAIKQSYTEANQNIASALTRTAATQAAVLQMPKRRSRDTLQLIDGVDEDADETLVGETYERKVA